MQRLIDAMQCRIADRLAGELENTFCSLENASWPHSQSQEHIEHAGG
jgi:hypothetical protein